MATNLTQIADEQRALAALKEEQDLKAALLSNPPAGTEPYALTRGMWDGRDFTPKGSIVFFKPGQAPSSAKKLKADENIGAALSPEGDVKIAAELELPGAETELVELLTKPAPKK